MHATINKKERTCDIERDSICTVHIRRNLSYLDTVYASYKPKSIKQTCMVLRVQMHERRSKIIQSRDWITAISSRQH